MLILWVPYVDQKKEYYLIGDELLLVNYISHSVSLGLVRLRVHNRVKVEGLLVSYALLVHMISILIQLPPQVDVFDGWRWKIGARKNAPIIRAHGC